jgi:pimeloyl-ACP methyl ester carboxylesterase
MKRIEIDALGIAYERTGGGPPVVLLHGGVSDHREWRPQVDRLAEEFDVVAWDAPGNGASDDPPPGWRMPEYADCLASFIRALALDRPHVVGLSFGSTLALELYRRHPELPRSLALLGAYAGWAGSLPPEEIAARLTGVERDLAHSPAELASTWLPTLLTADAPPGLAEELFAIVADVHPDGTRTMVRAMAEADLRDVLPRVAAPTLLLYGELDARSPLRVARDLHERIPGSTLVVVEGAGHMVNVEAPERTTAELRTFLAAHRGLHKAR